MNKWVNKEKAWALHLLFIPWQFYPCRQWILIFSTPLSSLPSLPLTLKFFFPRSNNPTFTFSMCDPHLSWSWAVCVNNGYLLEHGQLRRWPQPWRICYVIRPQLLTDKIPHGVCFLCFKWFVIFFFSWICVRFRLVKLFKTTSSTSMLTLWDLAEISTPRIRILHRSSYRSLLVLGRAEVRQV